MVEIVTAEPARLERVTDTAGVGDFVLEGLTARGRFQTSVRIWLPYMPDRLDPVTGAIIEQGSVFQDVARVDLGAIPPEALQPDGSFLFEINRHQLRALAGLINSHTLRDGDRAQIHKWKW